MNENIKDPMKEACKWAIPSIAACYAAYVLVNPGADGLVFGSVIAAIVTLVNIFVGRQVIAKVAEKPSERVPEELEYP